MVDPISWARFGLELGKGLFSLAKGGYNRFKKSPPEEVLRRRKQLRTEMEEHFPSRDVNGNLGQAIIRDIDRMDYYLHDNPKKAYASYAWFKVSIKDVTYRGLDCFISMPTTIIYDEERQRWRFTKSGEEGILAFPVGKIPYENIIEINWNGDEYYPFPHIYCRYRSGSPYYAIHYYISRGEKPYEYMEQVENFEPHKKRWF